MPRGSGIVLILAALAAAPAAQAEISLDVVGRADAENGGVGQTGQYGDYGLFLGPDFNNPGYDTGPLNGGNGYREYFNWRWTDMDMSIDDTTGTATITGSMSRLYDEMQGWTTADDPWSVTITMTDLVIKGGWAASSAYAGATQVGNYWYGVNPYAGMVDDLLATGSNGFGLEWESLTMVIEEGPNYSTSVPVEPLVWTGLTMPDIGHPNVAELHYRDASAGDLGFSAWYQYDPTYGDPDQGGGSYWYKVGDTKANVALVSSPPPPPDGDDPPPPEGDDPAGVPEPPTWLMLLGGLLAAAGARRRAMGPAPNA